MTSLYFWSTKLPRSCQLLFDFLLMLKCVRYCCFLVHCRSVLNFLKALSSLNLHIHTHTHIYVLCSFVAVVKTGFAEAFQAHAQCSHKHTQIKWWWLGILEFEHCIPLYNNYACSLSNYTIYLFEVNYLPARYSSTLKFSWRAWALEIILLNERLSNHILYENTVIAHKIYFNCI